MAWETSFHQVCSETGLVKLQRAALPGELVKCRFAFRRPAVGGAVCWWVELMLWLRSQAAIWNNAPPGVGPGCGAAKAGEGCYAEFGLNSDPAN